jgi:hypothetical protein
MENVRRYPVQMSTTFMIVQQDHADVRDHWCGCMANVSTCRVVERISIGVELIVSAIMGM